MQESISPPSGEELLVSIPPSPKLVALLGITGRQIQAVYPGNLGLHKQSKVLAYNAKTPGDWLKFKRLEKNLTRGHVAAKMGIAASLVCSWESGSQQPDTHLIKILATILEFSLRDFETQPTISILQ